MYVFTLLCIVLIVFEQKNVASTNLSNDKNQLQRIDDQIVETNDAYQERNHVKINKFIFFSKLKLLLFFY